MQYFSKIQYSTAVLHQKSHSVKIVWGWNLIQWCQGSLSCYNVDTTFSPDYHPIKWVHGGDYCNNTYHRDKQHAGGLVMGTEIYYLCL